MQAIRQHRLKLNLSQEKLAEMLGVKRTTVTKWESGANTPRGDMLPKIAKILSCEIADLFLNPVNQKT